MTITLITGANKGLGFETARRLTGVGHTVYLGARDAERGKAAARSVGAHFVQLDVTDDASVDDGGGVRAGGRWSPRRPGQQCRCGRLAGGTGPT